MLGLLGGAGGSLISSHWHKINVSEREKGLMIYIGLLILYAFRAGAKEQHNEYI